MPNFTEKKKMILQIADMFFRSRSLTGDSRSSSVGDTFPRTRTRRRCYDRYDREKLKIEIDETLSLRTTDKGLIPGT